jgi:hypothetical protein
MGKEHVFGVIHLKHSPKIFFISILIFSVIYWYLGANSFFGNIAGNGVDPWGNRIQAAGYKYTDYLYFSIVVQSLLGFGDVIPNTGWSRIFVCLQIMISMYLLLSTGSAIIEKVL